LSDPSRPLLRRLSLEAPGTYAHSVAMANLVEAACNRIGANGLLGRVGCYYHDIGKVKNPLYFVENQIPGNNPHDRLKPVQSAQIIKAHVIDGLALAAEAQLPDSVAAFIPEHHEAPLTLQQIEQVKAAFLLVLSGMYHNRIDYPESSGGIGAAWQPATARR